jgi:transcriptional regulator with XRE-family HTH domain
MYGIGERLKTLRKENDMTLDELGVKLNMPKSSLSRYENGESDPSIETVKKIASFFNVSIDWLAGLSDSRNSEQNYDFTYKDIVLECHKNNISVERLKKFIDLIKEGE